MGHITSAEYNILLVEDNPGDRDLICEYLEDTGNNYHIETASSLSDALGKNSTRSFSVILLDLGLPDSVGLDTLKSFVGKTPDIPIVVLTGLDDERTGIEAIRDGAQDYLVKGQVNSNLLVRAIRHADERNALKNKIDHYNRVLRAIRDLNQLIVLEKDTPLLIKRACELLTQTHGYMAAWIALGNCVDPPLFSSQSGYSNSLLSSREFQREFWPPCIKELKGRHEKLLIRRPEDSCECALFENNREGYGGISILHHGKYILGCMAVLFPTNFKPGIEEKSLLREITEDISFALHSIETKKLKQKAENLYQKLYTNMQQGVIYQDKTGKVVDANRKAQKILGISMDKIISSGLSHPGLNTIHEDGSIYPEEEHPSSLSLKTGKSEVGIMGVYNPEIQEHCWIKMYAVPEINKETGRPESVFTTFEDITELRKAETHIKNQHRFLQTLMDTMPIFIFYKDTKCVYIGCNKAYTDFLGLSQEDVIGKTVFDIFPEELAYRNNRIDTALIKNPGIKQYETTMVTKDGTKRDLITSKATYLDDKGNAAGIIGATIDITKRKEMERHLLQAQKMEAIGTLAGGIAHDFNNILSAILGFTELALDCDSGEGIRRDLEEVFSAGQRAKELVKQILAFARQSEEEIKPIQVDIIIKEVLKFIRSSIPATIEIKSNINSSSVIMGNQIQIHQVIMNLCTNAAQAMEENGGVLDITLRDVVFEEDTENKKLKKGNYLEIIVSDTGTGIPPEIIDTVFEPYFTTKDPGEGTGLGLAMVQGIVESYGGQITVKSKVGKGTTFFIYLPSSQKLKFSRSCEQEQLPQGTEKILVVDDEPAIARVCSNTLMNLGYNVKKSTDSTEALELFKSNPDYFDLVITDMTMPGLTGDRLAAEILDIRPDIPVILCSGYSKKISEKSAYEIGVKAYIFKPFVKAELAKTVRKVLDEYRPLK